MRGHKAEGEKTIWNEVIYQNGPLVTERGWTVQVEGLGRNGVGEEETQGRGGGGGNPRNCGEVCLVQEGSLKGREVENVCG